MDPFPPRTRRRLRATLLALALGALATAPGLARADGVYRWTDESGREHFTDRWGDVPRKVQRQYVKEGRAPAGAVDEPTAPAPSGPPPRALPPTRVSNPVDVRSPPTPATPLGGGGATGARGPEIVPPTKPSEAAGAPATTPAATKLRIPAPSGPRHPPGAGSSPGENAARNAKLRELREQLDKARASEAERTNKKSEWALRFKLAREKRDLAREGANAARMQKELATVAVQSPYAAPAARASALKASEQNFEAALERERQANAEYERLPEDARRAGVPPGWVREFTAESSRPKKPR